MRRRGQAARFSRTSISDWRFAGTNLALGPARFWSRENQLGVTVAWMPRLSRVVFQDVNMVRRDEVICVSGVPQSEQQPGQAARLRFVWSSNDSAAAGLRLAITFELAARAKTIATRRELHADQPCKLLAFEGPMVYALARDEAIYPGVEWLVDDEVSSGTLDIAEGHPDRIRYVVHSNFITIPAMGVFSGNGTVGLLWNVHQKWDDHRDRPSAVFASPDRFENQRAHLTGLFLPTVPEFVQRNKREAEQQTPYFIEPGKPIRLDAQIYADAEASDALAAVDQWAGVYGYPQAAPLPRGSYEREIQFSMRGYLESLWVPEEQTWWTSKGGGMLSVKGRPRAFVADLLLGAMLSPDAEVRRQCRARADEVLALIGGEPRLDAQRFPGRLDQRLSNPSAAALLASRDQDGAWRFDADQQGTVVVFNVARPNAVLSDARPVAERSEIDTGSTPLWRYEPSAACLSTRVPHEGRSAVRVEGAAFRRGPQTPQLAEKIAFEFHTSLDGWAAAHDVGELEIDFVRAAP